MDPKFHLKVASREGIVYKGDVSAISSYNDKGRFDVLASHANFISLIQKGLTIREANAEDKTGEKEISFDNALMRVLENNVEVYLGIENSPNT